MRIGSGEGSTIRDFTVCIGRVIKSRRLIWAGHAARIEEGRSTFKILAGELTGKRPLGRPRRKWEDNIRVDLKEIDVNRRNWTDSDHERDFWKAFVNVTLNFRVP